MNKEWKAWIRNPPKQFRPIPFWSWNARLHEEETVRQIALMDQAGLGGVFMHARGGLLTGYMGHEWMANVRRTVEECVKRGMTAWGYDENGWPSGSNGGAVCRRGEAYQQKYLRCAQMLPENGALLARIPVEGTLYFFYYERNPDYVDLLEPKVTQAFLRDVHQQYKRRLGERMGGLSGFFTDEPQISRNGYPWSLTLPDAYQREYGESLLERLPDLFFQTDTASRTRIRFWKLVTDLFSHNYAEQLAGWCHENSVQLTGHLACEESLGEQITANGACMPHYEWFDIPGVDWLGRGLGDGLTVLQASCTAHQLGKPQILSESFALCGWNVSFEELRWILEWQMVRGVTLPCQHLEPYSLAGIRKRDYPAALFFQQPWWKEYRKWNDFVSRIGMLLTLGAVRFDVLLLHPQQSAWALYDNSRSGSIRINALNQSLLDVIKALEDAQIPFHLGDDHILIQHGHVEGDLFCVGTQRYHAVIIPPCLSLSERVLTLLTQFAQNGGSLFWVKAETADGDGIPDLVDGAFSTGPRRLAAASVCTQAHHLPNVLPPLCQPLSLTLADGAPAAGIAATVRCFDQEGFRMYYLVNSMRPACFVRLTVNGADAALLDAETGKTTPLICNQEGGSLHLTLRLEEKGSAVVFVYDQPQRFTRKRKATSRRQESLQALMPSLLPDWKIVRCDLNTLTLDRCDCYINGQLAEKNIPAIEVTELACALGEPVELRLIYRFQIAQPVPGPLFLLCETPQNYRFILNGRPARLTPCGYYRDRAFVKLNITKYVQMGCNEICMETCFQQYGSVYRDFRAAAQGFEAIRNRLTYHEEIEAVYLAGHFRVDTPGSFQTGEREDCLYHGGFALAAPPATVHAGDLVRQGFPFFSGQITLSNTFQLRKEECMGRRLCFARRGAIVLSVRVNGKSAGKIFWRPYEIQLDGLLHEGENCIEVTLTGSLRNLLGPHHLKSKESYSVSPGSFYRRSYIWRREENPDWTNDYRFVEFGLFLSEKEE